MRLIALPTSSMVFLAPIGWWLRRMHDGYRSQIHVRDGRVRLYTMNANDWTGRYPLIVQAAARLKGSAILDAEVACLGEDGAADFDLLQSRVHDQRAVALAFDLLMLDGDDMPSDSGERDFSYSLNS